MNALGQRRPLLGRVCGARRVTIQRLRAPLLGPPRAQTDPKQRPLEETSDSGRPQPGSSGQDTGASQGSAPRPWLRFPFQIGRRQDASTSAGSSTGDGSDDSYDDAQEQPQKQQQQQRRPPGRQRSSWRPSTSDVLRWLRALGLTCLALVALLLGRHTALVQARAQPREVLYSDFVQLLERGRVASARLQTGASPRLVFSLTDASPATAHQQQLPQQQQQPQAQEQQQKAGAQKRAWWGGRQPAPAQAPPDAAVAASIAAPAPAAAPVRRLYVKLADKYDPFLMSKVMSAGVEFAVVRAGFGASLANTLLTVVAVWVPLLPLLFLARRLLDQRGGGGAGARRKAPAPGTPKVTFDDVAGADAAKVELAEVVAILKGATEYAALRARMPGGVLLSGPPGTGKTLLARAVAGEAGVPFLSVSASEFVELFVGRGAARVRELFADARRCAPCVVFIDELDAVGSRRGSGFNDERDQTLNQLLTELDGFEGRPGVLLLAATNRPDVLDPALLRPGRISRRVVVPLPDEPGRAAVLAVHLRGVPTEGDEDALELGARLAAITPGFSGAELANVVNEATLLAARRGSEAIGLLDLLQGVRRTRYGIDGRGGGGLFGDGLAQRLGGWLMDAASKTRQVKVSSA